MEHTFVADLKRSDAEYLTSVELLCNKLNDLLIRKLDTQRGGCRSSLLEITRKLDIAESKTKKDNLEDLTSKMIELEHIDAEILRDHPSIDQLSLELSSELTFELKLSQLQDREKAIDKIKESRELFVKQCETLFLDSQAVSRGLKDSDQEFFSRLRLSDIKFRDILSIRLSSRDSPISFALRDALVSERDEKRRKLVGQMFVSKDAEHTTICERNAEANKELISKLELMQSSSP